MSEHRTGLGFDVHRSDAARPLVLGTLRFEGEPGLLGHSDGDAVCHAIADALLGSLAMGDVGQHFPDTEPAVRGIAGADLLGRVTAMVTGTGARPVSVDCTIVCERPAIAPRRDEMRAALASVLGIEVSRVSVKATRPEGLGLTGDGIGCLAVATVAVP